jgi:hypothetical protein
VQDPARNCLLQLAFFFLPGRKLNNGFLLRHCLLLLYLC